MSLVRETGASRLIGSSVQVVDAVLEGTTFRVRLQVEGAMPSYGGCDLSVSDSHGYSSTSYARATGVDASVAIGTTHDAEDDTGRTVTVSITACELQDADRQAIAYSIGAGSITVPIESAGPLPDPVGSYTVTVDNAPASVNEGQRVVFSMSFDNPLPACPYGYSCPAIAKVHVKIVDSELGTVYFYWRPVRERSTSRRYTHGIPNTDNPSTDRTVTFSVEGFQAAGNILNANTGSTYTVGGTWIVGDPASVTVRVNDVG